MGGGMSLKLFGVPSKVAPFMVTKKEVEKGFDKSPMTQYLMKNINKDLPDERPPCEDNDPYKWDEKNIL